MAARRTATAHPHQHTPFFTQALFTMNLVQDKVTDAALRKLDYFVTQHFGGEVIFVGGETVSSAHFLPRFPLIDPQS